MSEMTPERPAPARRGNVFTNRIGPLPMWVWLVIIGGAIVTYSLWKRQKAGSTSATGTDASQVPQFVNQTYTTVTAPVSTPPTAVPHPKEPGPFPRPEQRPPPPPPPYQFPGGSGGMRTERLRNRGNIEQIAKRNGIDVEDLLEANPELAKYKGTRKQVPIGTIVRIPSAAT